MKKSTLSLALGICLSITGLAQTQRTILYEEFTGENCNPCAGTNPGLTTFIHQAGYFPAKVLMVRYQCNIPSAPGTGSLYLDSKTDETVRQTYYNTPFAPYARFDGIVLLEPASQGTGSDGHAAWIEQPYYPNIVTDSATTNAPFALSVNHVFNATFDSVIITAVITAAQNYTASTTGALVLQLAMEEAEIHFATPTGTNGEKDFYDIMRKMVPSSTGTALNNTWATTATQTVTLKAKIPTYIHDKNQISFVAFIQDNGPKRVHQAAYSQPKAVSLDASTFAIVSSAVICNTSIPVSATIKNPGGTTLTSCIINYKLDAGTVNTYNWTGSLVQGASITVALPNLTGTLGTHTITINTSMPNGSADQNTANDKQVTTIVIEGTPSGTPVVEGFTGTTFPPVNWVKHDPLSAANTWKRDAIDGGYQTSTNSAMYPFYSNSADGAFGELYIPIENLSGMTSPQLHFDYAYDYYDTLGTAFYDSLAVMASIDCGTTWSTLWLEGGPGLSTATTPGNSNTNGFEPGAAEWKTQVINLSTYASQTSFLVKFVAINHYGNNFYMDNINLSSLGSAGITKHGNISNVKVYPNPANTQVNVNVNLTNAQNTTLTLYNVMGQVVMTKNYDFNAGNNTANINIDQLASGMYTLSVASANGLYQTKISVVK